MDALLDEVQSLEAILMEDVKIEKNPKTGFPELIETTVFPTVGEETDRQYICVTLQVMPEPGYPDISPNFVLVKPRGLDDYRLNEIKNACVKKLSDSLGYPVVFDLIDVIREHLTGSNLPSGQCVVCLYGFHESDEFTKTECYHYLHSYCLARHLIASKKNYQEEQDKLPPWLKKKSGPFQTTCPVCREPITDDSESLKNSKPPLELESAPDFQLTKELNELQKQMANLFLYQKSRGAIIDPEAEEYNIISLGPEGSDSTETNNSEYNQSDSLVRENGSGQNVSIVQSSTHSNRRSNPHLRGNQTNNNLTSVGSSASSRHAEESSNHSSRHSRRHHHHQHQRSRRHHNHHYSDQNNSSQQQQTQQETSQRKGNVRASCGTGAR